jgi:hypothetical protein
VIGAFGSGLCGDPWPGALAVHVDKRRLVAKVDDNSGTGAYVSCQLPRRESPIVLYLVNICDLVLTKRRRPRHSVVRQPSDRTESDGGVSSIRCDGRVPRAGEQR